MSSCPKSYILLQNRGYFILKNYISFPFLSMFLSVQKTLVFHQAFLSSTLSLLRICKNTCVNLLLVVFKAQVDGK